MELPERLQFASGYESGRIDFMAPPAALVIAFLWTMISQSYVLAGSAALVYLLLALWWLTGGAIRLFVSASALLAQGHVGRFFPEVWRVPNDELTSLVYSEGGPGEPAGLYAHHGIQRTRLIPGLSVREADRIVAAIYEKFPCPEHDQLAAMKAVHEGAYGQLNPQVALAQLDPFEDLRHWRVKRTRELEMENRRAWTRTDPQKNPDEKSAVENRDLELNQSYDNRCRRPA